MRHKIAISILCVLATLLVQAQLPERKPLRIVDTMTQQERTSRNPILLRSELDSMIREYNALVQAKLPAQEQVKPATNTAPPELRWGLAALFAMLVWILYQVYSHRRKFNKTAALLIRQLRYREGGSGPLLPPPAKETNSIKGTTTMAKDKLTKGRLSAPALENRIGELNDELLRLKKENESLNRVVKEYNGIQHEYDSLKNGLSKAYKVKNYPGYEKTKAETTVLQGVLDTESAVATYAYEKFLKPILAISDANKNSPARISEEDRTKVMDLLISLSLLYIEYLYLRVNELAIGGKMVERINGFQHGNGLDPALLKELNLEHGSRALVLRMILDKSKLDHLSYPVFDETNLNHQ